MVGICYKNFEKFCYKEWNIKPSFPKNQRLLSFTTRVERDSLTQVVVEYKETLESLDAELLYLSGVIDCPISYNSTKDKAFQNFGDSDQLNQIRNTYEIFKNHKIEGFCTLHFAKISLAENFSLLAGFMKSFPSVKKDVESLLQKCLDLKVRKLLSAALKECNDSNLTVETAEDMLVTFQLSSPEAFYPQYQAAGKITDTTAVTVDNTFVMLGDSTCHMDDLYSE